MCIRDRSVIRSPRSDTESSIKLHQTVLRPRGSASLCALKPMVATAVGSKRGRALEPTNAAAPLSARSMCERRWA
eukprot:15177820-Alexandrium_andersonii.AAC.1